tara:strand:- start:592 stop:1302 length:711 start_codon:yes stop_codon:yes gene_type:complete
MKIIFKALDKKHQDYMGIPKPTKSLMPDWFKNIPMYASGLVPEPKLKLAKEYGTNMTVKKCVPFTDAMLLGYTVDLPCEVILEQKNDSYNIDWKLNANVFSLHQANSMMIDTPFGYHKHISKFNWGTIPLTPKGYSTLVLPSFINNDSPFKAVPAIIDTDVSEFSFSLPVWVSNHHDGIVKIGTPIAQLLPFKRDNWKMETSYWEDDEYDVLRDITFAKKVANHYARLIHKKKEFK